jgi:hypothetical protein
MLPFQQELVYLSMKRLFMEYQEIEFFKREI